MSQYIQDKIRNNLRSIVRSCTVPQQKSVHEVVRDLFVEQTPILRHLAQNKKLSKVFDGSKRTAAKEYTLHGVGVHERLLKLKVHDGAVCTLRRRTIYCL